MITQAQYTITALHDGADALVLSVSSDAGTIAKNAPLDATLSARVSRGGRELTAEEIAALGVVDWYRDGSDFAAARGLSLPVSAAAAAAWEARLEQPDPALRGPSVSFSAAAPHPLKQLRIDLVPAQDLHGYDAPWPAGCGANVFGDYTVAERLYLTVGGGSAVVNSINAADRSILVPCEGSALYTVTVGIDTTVRLASFPADPARGDSSTTYADGGTLEAGTPVSLSTGPEDRVLFLQLLTNTEIGSGLTLEDALAGLRIVKGPHANLCPISGSEGLTLSRTAGGAGTDYPVDFGGTVYYGAWEAVTGRLVSSGRYRALTGGENWTLTSSGGVPYYRLLFSNTGATVVSDTGLCSHLPRVDAVVNYSQGFRVFNSSTSSYLAMRCNMDELDTVAKWKAWLAAQAEAGTPVMICYELTERSSYYTERSLTPLSLYAAAGENVFSAGGEELTLIPSSRILARGSLGLAAVYDGERGLQGPPGADGRSSYLHVKYSDDGAHFTGRNGEDLGLFIGTLVDFEEQDSTDFSAYTWRRFADDTELMGYVDDKEEKLYETLRGRYVAVSDFGSYTRDSQAIIEANSRGVEELYRQTESLESAARQTGESLSAFTQLMEGQLRRGFLTDPDTGETVFGIAVSQRLNFTGAERTEGGERYYELSDQGAFGLYTATGWQYWINGRKVGWFQSGDSRLHLRSLQAEEEISLGAWRLSSAGGLGLRV